jgi:tRNA threonylcarbamoyladenosine biosynthesis protein TsaE
LDKTFISNSKEETIDFGDAIGRIASEGDVLLLRGPLGVGKTCLTKGVARGLGIDRVVQSPTFMLIREYQGRLPLYHMDLYRLVFKEIDELGLDEYLYGNGVCVIEWAENGEGLMPPDAIVISIEYIDDNRRKITVTDDNDTDFIDRLQKELK